MGRLAWFGFDLAKYIPKPLILNDQPEPPAQ
jgi:hypothetical protein